MELNTILWGGQFNPIIPTYQRLPSGWHRTARTGAARDVFTGYLEAFDPDYVVSVGKVTEPPFPVGHRSVLSAKAVLGTQGYAADWTIAQLREPAQEIADRIEALMHPSEAPSSTSEVASTVVPGIGR